MNPDELDTLWQSPRNQPSAAQLETEKMEFLTTLRKRRRGEVIFMLWIFTLLSVITVLFLRQIIHPDPAHDTIKPFREWGAVLLMALPWACLVLFYRSHRRHCRSHPDYQRSILAALRALLDQNLMVQARQKWVAGLWLVMLLLMPVIVYQLRAAGKAGDEIMVPALVLLPLLMLGIFLGMFYYHRHHLRPAQHRLEHLLAGYASPVEEENRPE